MASNQCSLARACRRRCPVAAAVVIVFLVACDGRNPAQPDSHISASKVALAAATSELACGSTITTNVTLAADLVCVTVPGLIVDADDVTLDGNGHTLSGPGCEPGVCPTLHNSGVWIRPGHRRVTIRNLHVTRFITGIEVVEVIPGYGACNVLLASVSTEHVIAWNTLVGNVGGGISLSCSHGNQILDNTIADNGGGPWSATGISITGSRNGGNLIAGNRVERQAGMGLMLVFAPGNTVRGNTFSSNSTGIWTGGWEPAAPTDNVFEDNIIESNGYRGIEIHGDRNRIARNRIAGNTSGIELHGSIHMVEDNVVVSNRELGIGVGAHNSVVRRNNISQNGIRAGYAIGGTGLSVGGSYNEVTDNTVVENGGLGVHCGGSNNRIHDNTVARNVWFGFMLNPGPEESPACVVFHNDIIGNNPTHIGKGAYAGQVYDDNPARNQWHEPSLLEGNYWSDYTGVDDGSGTDKHAVAGDGIGDTRIPYPASGFDFYPFVEPGGWRVRIVAIDIKPGSFPNSINLRSEGTVPVAILGAKDFDARSVDRMTVSLAGAPAKLRRNGTVVAAAEDVNADGLPDLVVHVETAALQLNDADTQAVLVGRTFDGRRIRGSDSVKVVP